MSLFPTKIFLTRWHNRPAQIQFLSEAVQVAPEIFTMCKSINRFVVSKEKFVVNNATKFFINSAIQSCWNSLDLIELLVEYSANAKNQSESCRPLIELGLDQAPDLFLLAFAQFNMPWSALVKDLAPKLVISMITGHVHSQIVLPRVWELNPLIILSGFILMYLADNSSLSRILDVAQDLKALTKVLESKHFGFAIDLAALSSRREYLNLEKWMLERIRNEGDVFFRSCLDFLNEKINLMTSNRHDVPQSVTLTSDVAMTFARVLHSVKRFVIVNVVKCHPRI
jgi:CCR4-NOT transcription complex subunit 1